MGIRVLAGIAENGRSDAARVAAVALLFERGWGKAPQAETSDGDHEIRVIIRDLAAEARSDQVIEAKPLQLAGNGKRQP